MNFQSYLDKHKLGDGNHTTSDIKTRNASNKPKEEPNKNNPEPSKKEDEKSTNKGISFSSLCPKCRRTKSHCKCG